MRTEFDNRIKLGIFVSFLIYTINDKNIYSAHLLIEEVKIQISMVLVQVV